MGEMIERIARALHHIWHASDWDNDVSQGEKDDFRIAARSAIEAMREPTSDMLIAGLQAFENAPLQNDDNSDLTPQWQAMIEAALKS